MDAPHKPQFDGGVALVSPCGWGNFGDAAIVDSVIHAVRTRLPGAPIVALTLNPEDTVARHHVPAFTCSGFSRPNYGVRQFGEGVVHDTNGATRRSRSPAAVLRGLVRRAPLLGKSATAVRSV